MPARSHPLPRRKDWTATPTAFACAENDADGANVVSAFLYGICVADILVCPSRAMQSQSFPESARRDRNVPHSQIQSRQECLLHLAHSKSLLQGRRLHSMCASHSFFAKV